MTGGGGVGGPGTSFHVCGGGAGGGGAGVTGGAGGSGGVGTPPVVSPGGAGGASAGASGHDGNNAGYVDGGGGGGGGAHGAVVTTSTSNAGSVAGGKGGNGGDGGAASYAGGGGGGAGGYGVIVNSSGLTYTNSGTVRGGNGGSGGHADFAVGGFGGDGGNGIVFTGTGGTLVNSSIIAGGDGGAGGTGGQANGFAGAGGVGIQGTNLTIINSGSIAGGLSGNGATRADAIDFGGNDVLELRAGSTITGGVFASGNDILRLGGTSDSSFDVSIVGTQYVGFSGLVKTGTSTWVLTGTATTSTPWTINQGTLAVSSDANLGAGAGALTFNGGTLQFLAGFNSSRSVTLNSGGGSFDTDGNNVTLSGAIGGAGALTKIGGGTLTLTGTNTYGGGTIINGGTLAIASDSNLGDAAGGLSFNGGALQVTSGMSSSRSVTLNAGGGTFDSGSNFLVLGGNIDGTGALTKTGSGVMFLSGSNGYTGATNVNGGLLAIVGATTGTLAFNVDNAQLAVSGGGSINPNAAVTLVNGAQASFLTSAPSIGALTGDASTNVTLVAGTVLSVGADNASTTFAGDLGNDGNGALTKVGSGTLALTGTNRYSGNTTVNGGTLEVDGSIAASSNVTVNSGGTLTGTGIVDPATTTIMAGGTLAPGNASNPTGTLTITGNLAFQSGAIYLVHLTPSGAASTVVSGTAALTGATVNAAFANGSFVGKTYTILTVNGGINGTFGTLVNTNLPANFRSSLSYGANNAFLNLSLDFTSGTTPPNSTPSNPISPNGGSGLSGNQQAGANALVNSFNSNGGIPMVYGTLTAAGLTQASGELATASQQTTFDAMSQFMGLLTDPFMQRGGGPGPASGGAAGFVEQQNASSYAANRRTDAFAMFTKAPPRPFEPRWSVWAAGFGGSQSTDGNVLTGSNNATSRLFGSAVGADYLFSPNTLAGFALAGGGTNFSVNGLGTGRSDLFQAGAYLRHVDGPAYVSAALAYGWQDITTDRDVTIAGIDRLRAEFNANAYSGRVEGGYRFVAPVIGGVGITPYAAGQFTTFDLPSYLEHAVVGSNDFALAYGSKSVTDTRSELGIRTDKSFVAQSGIVTLRGRFAWAHDFDPDRNVFATFQALPGASFVVNGARPASDSALTTASVEWKSINGWSVAATFEGEFSNVTRSYAGEGVFRYVW